MTAVFISHSSKDNASAEALRDWLQEQGYSVFLDFDPEAGIKGGKEWERVLYDRLRRCQAVVPVLTESWLASKWCFAELVQARAGGKAVIPVKAADCRFDDILGDTQQIDLNRDRQEGLARLRQALTEVFPWDSQRPPYPGLMSFQERDAAIYFGRSREIAALGELLEGLRRQGPAADSVVLLLGASGSGKSSLVRAGLIPRLRIRDGWLPLSAFRPRSDPLGEFATVLAEAFERAGAPPDYDALRDRLAHAAGSTPADGGELLAIRRDLALKTGDTEAILLVILDQAEELFGASGNQAADRFLGLIGSAIARSEGRIMLLATLRSEFLGRFQTHPFLSGTTDSARLRYRQFGVDPLPVEQFRAIIQQPAALAGIAVDDALVEQMVADTRTPDALPLLAYTLRRLWDDAGYRADGRFEVRDYRQLGGLEGSIRRAAEDVYTASDLDRAQRLALREALVPSLVRGGADGSWVKHRAYRDELPAAAREAVRRFVQARLLVTDQDQTGRETIELAHEALLRVWPRLSGWLREDRERLQLFQGIRDAAREWGRSERRPDLLVHRGERLAEALELVAEPRFAFKPGSVSAEYLALCEQGQREREQTERAERERRVRDAERLAAARSKTIRRTRQGLFTVLLVALVAVAAAWIALDQMEEAQYRRLEAEQASRLAEQQRRQAEGERTRAQEAQRRAQREAGIARARWLSVQAEAMVDTSPQRALLLATEALRRPWELDGTLLPDVETVLRGLLSRIGGVSLRGHANAIDRILIDPKGRWIASRDGPDGTLRLWFLEEPWKPAITLPVSNKWFKSMAFDPRGRWLVTGSRYGEISLWDLDTLARLSGNGELKKAWRQLPGRISNVYYLAFDAEGRWLATYGRSNADIDVWDLDDPEKAPLVLSRPGENGVGPSLRVMDRKGRWLALGHSRGSWLWDLNQPEAKPRLLSYDGRSVDRLALDPTGEWLVTSDSFSDTVRFWDLTHPEQSPRVSRKLGSPMGSDIQALKFDARGRRLTVVTGDPRIGGRKGKVYRFDLSNPAIEPLPSPSLAVVEAAPAFDPAGRWLVSHGKKTVHLQDPKNRSAPPLVLRGGDEIVAHAFAPDGRRLVTGGRKGELRIWSLSHPVASPTVIPCESPGQAPDIAFDPRSGRLVTAVEDGPMQFRDPKNPFAPDVVACDPLYDGYCATSGHPIFDPTGRWLARAHSVWDLDKPGAEPGTLHGGGDVAFGPKGRWLAAKGQGDHGVLLWELVDGLGERRELRSGEGGKSVWVAKPAFDPAGSRLATANWDETIRLWDLTNPEASSIKLPGRWRSVIAHYGSYSIWQLAFGPKGRWLAAASEDAVRLYDLSDPDPKPLFLREKDETVGNRMWIAFDPQHRWLAVARHNGNLRLWSLADPSAKPLLLMAEDRPLWNPLFDGSGQWLAATGGDDRRTVYLWYTRDLKAGPVILHGHEGEVEQLAFDPQSRWLATAARDGSVRLWPLPVEALVALACRTVGRNLAPDEWQRYLGDREYRRTCPGVD